MLALLFAAQRGPVPIPGGIVHRHDRSHLAPTTQSLSTLTFFFDCKKIRQAFDVILEHALQLVFPRGLKEVQLAAVLELGAAAVAAQVGHDYRVSLLLEQQARRA